MLNPTCSAEIFLFFKRFNFLNNTDFNREGLFKVCWKTNKENRIYVREEFTRKKCKTSILLYCFHTAGILHIFMLFNLLGPGTSFYRKSKINIKRKPNYEIACFHNWLMIISHRLYAFHFTNDDFRYNYKSNDVFIHLIH